MPRNNRFSLIEIVPQVPTIDSNNYLSILIRLWPG